LNWPAGRAVHVPLGADPETGQDSHLFISTPTTIFWFGLDGGGLARWRHGEVGSLGKSKPANLRTLSTIFAEDTEGYIWLGMRARADLELRKADLNSFLDGKTATETERGLLR